MNFQNINLSPAQVARIDHFLAGYPNPHTSSAYRSDLAQFLHWAENEGGVDVRTLAPGKVDKLLGSYKQTLGNFASSTAARKIKVARYYFQSLGLNPDVQIPDAPKLIGSWIKVHDVERILKSEKVTSRQKMLIALLALEGLRPSEITELVFSPVTEPKFTYTGTYVYLQEYLKERGRLQGPLFFAEDSRGRRRHGRPLSRQWVWKESRAIGEILNIKECTPAALRITSVVWMSGQCLETGTIADRLGVHRDSINRILRGTVCAGK